PAPRPTLFPYTTLFRSAVGEPDHAAGLRDDAVADADPHAAQDGMPESVLPVQQLRAAGDGRDAEGAPAPARAQGQRRRQGKQEGDRKSTRLNSSHVAIS